MRTFPELPGATNCGALVPFPSNTLFAVNAARPVPPLATGSVPVMPVVKDTLVIVLLAPLMVLFVNVSVVARPTSVSVAVGSVTVPVFEIVEITGAVSVLFVSDWVLSVSTIVFRPAPVPIVSKSSLLSQTTDPSAV